jgi:hypothetical protein
MCGVTRRSLLAGGLAVPLALSIGGGSAWGAPSVAGASLRRRVEARRAFFGATNVDATGRVRPDRVILSWFGCTSFAMAIGGRVVLLDAWVPRGPYSDRVPTSVGQVADLAPSHVFIGHGHYDHAADAAPIAVSSGAVVVGTPEHCEQARGQAGEASIRTRPFDLPSTGDETELLLGRDIRITAMRHLHSAAKAPSGDEQPLVLPPDLTPIVENPPRVEDGVDTLAHQADQEGGSLLYRFDIGRFSLTWNDTAGPIATDAPQVVEALAGRSRSTVQIAAVQGFGQYTNGLRDPMDYVEAVRPRFLVPSHHDNWTPPVSTGAAGYEEPLRAELHEMPRRTRPELRFIRDTRDYLNPQRLTFDL